MSSMEKGSETSHAPGSLVEARGRVWIVLPQSNNRIIHAQPLGAPEGDATCLFPFMEAVEPAHASWPDEKDIGQYSKVSLLARAARIATRAGAGPYRALGKIAVEPRPYQFVPLMMAMRMETPRIFIADDVGVGKTVEALLIAKELLERGEANGVAVLCPPHLCEQWQAEMTQRFNIDAFILTAASAATVERSLPSGRSVFDVKKHFIVSFDYVKSDKKRALFEASCPNLIIVDEAHSCSNLNLGKGSGSLQKRHLLLQELAKNDKRSIILLSATPHSGSELGFYSLISLLGGPLSGFASKSNDERESLRAEVVKRFIQRRRVDISKDGDDFAKREIMDVSYETSKDSIAIISRVSEYVKGLIQKAESGTLFARRVSEWTAIALLRCVASSPYAAKAALENRIAALKERGASAHASPGEQRRFEAEATEDENELANELLPLASLSSFGDDASKELDVLIELLDMVDTRISGGTDEKLDKLVDLLRNGLSKKCRPEDGFIDGEGHSPVVFCRYINTAKYLEERLRSQGFNAVAVTGEMSARERDQAVEELGQQKKRVLIATDCLSEGVNLQAYFDAVIHYDLSWNPVRHEQREGRVDRLLQSKKVVRACTIFSTSNPVEMAVIEVITKKSRTIRQELGILVPVPLEEEQVNKTLISLMLFGKQADSVRRMDDQWKNAREGETKNRAKYAQHAINAEAAMEAWEKCYAKLGSTEQTCAFFTLAFSALVDNAVVEQRNDLRVKASLASLNTLPGMRHKLDVLGLAKTDKLSFRGEVGPWRHIWRSHPLIDALAERIRDEAFATTEKRSSRFAAIKTNEVSKPAIAMMIRASFKLTEVRDGKTQETICEEVFPIARHDKSGVVSKLILPSNLPKDRIDEPHALAFLLSAKVVGGVDDPTKRELLNALLQSRGAWDDLIATECKEKAIALKQDHFGLRDAARDAGARKVEWIRPAEPLVTVVLLPA